MRIRMLVDRDGSPDGFKRCFYLTGREYDVPSKFMSADLADVFLANKHACLVEEPTQREFANSTASKGPDHNRDAGPFVRNRSGRKAVR